MTRPRADLFDQLRPDTDAAVAAVLDRLLAAKGEWVPAGTIGKVAPGFVLQALRRFGAIAVRLTNPRSRQRGIEAYALTTLGEAWWLARERAEAAP